MCVYVCVCVCVRCISMSQLLYALLQFYVTQSFCSPFASQKTKAYYKRSWSFRLTLAFSASWIGAMLAPTFIDSDQRPTPFPDTLSIRSWCESATRTSLDVDFKFTCRVLHVVFPWVGFKAQPSQQQVLRWFQPACFIFSGDRVFPLDRWWLEWSAHGCHDFLRVLFIKLS